MTDTPQNQARVIIDPDNPEAGNGGVVPPVHSRFPPGKSPNPGGRPKGTSVLAAMLRELAREPDEDGIGKGTREIAQALLDVAAGRRAPDEIDTKAALAILDRTDGPIVKEQRVAYEQVREGLTLVKSDGPPPPLPVEEK